MPELLVDQMTASRIAILIASLTFIPNGIAQEVLPTAARDSAAAVLAAQINSPSNYSLLQPIAKKSTATTQSGLLQPIKRQGTAASQTRAMNTTAANASSVKVTPLSFQSGEFDRHQFKVQNVGSETLRGARVMLKAPEGSLVQQVIPKPDSVDGASIIFSISELAPGAHDILEVMIENPRNVLARFDSIVLAEDWKPGTQVAIPNLKETSPVEQNQGIVQLLQPRSSGMLKPSVPAMAASAKKSVQYQDQVAMATSTAAYPNVEALKVESAGYVSSSIYADAGEAAKTSYEEHSTVRAWLQGPDQVSVGQEVEYSVEVQNVSSQEARGAIVQLSIPQGMKITVLDRDAWYDAESRKISWEISSLQRKSLESIRYKAVFKKAGTSNEQSIVVGLNQTVQSTSSLQTVVQ